MLDGFAGFLVAVDECFEVFLVGSFNFTNQRVLLFGVSDQDGIATALKLRHFLILKVKLLSCLRVFSEDLADGGDLFERNTLQALTYFEGALEFWFNHLVDKLAPRRPDICVAWVPSQGRTQVPALGRSGLLRSHSLFDKAYVPIKITH